VIEVTKHGQARVDAGYRILKGEKSADLNLKTAKALAKFHASALRLLASFASLLATFTSHQTSCLATFAPRRDSQCGHSMGSGRTRATTRAMVESAPGSVWHAGLLQRCSLLFG
jgi:hypothetical protein